METLAGIGVYKYEKTQYKKRGKVKPLLFLTVLTFTFVLKGQFNPKSKIYFFIFTLTWRAAYPSRLFRCELQGFGDIGSRDACLLLNMIKFDVS